MRKIKILSSSKDHEIEEMINKWIEKYSTNKHIIDFKISTAMMDEYDVLKTVMIVYDDNQEPFYTAHKQP